MSEPSFKKRCFRTHPELRLLATGRAGICSQPKRRWSHGGSRAAEEAGVGERDPHGTVEGAPIEVGAGQGTALTPVVPVPGEPPDPDDARDGP